MRRRNNLAHLLFGGIVVLVLMLLMVAVDARAQIAFMSDRDGNWEIYVMDPNGNNQQNLTNSPDDEQHPSWSPDGQRIAFVFERHDMDWNRQISVMDADGGNQQNVTHHRAWDGSPSWSRNGKQIAFVSYRNVNADIYVMDADGSNQQNVTNNRHGDFSPAWLNSPFSVSPAGKRFTMWGRLKQVDR